MATQDKSDKDGGPGILRKPLPWWLRYFAPYPVAYDRLRSLIRYRPFDPACDLDPKQPGYLADTLQTGRMFIPSFSSLNDPWEAAPSLENYPWRRDLHTDIADFLSDLAPEVSSPESREKLLSDTRFFGTEALLRKTQQVLMDEFRGSPILSMSDRGDNFLMWSYYG